MESRIVYTFLLVFYLCNYNVGGSVEETIPIDNKVTIKRDGEIRWRNAQGETRARKSPLNIEIETSSSNATIIVCQKKLSSLKNVGIFRYCSQNGISRDKDPYIRINLNGVSSTEYAKKTKVNFMNETLPKMKNVRTTDERENIFTENCEIHLDPYCDATKDNENSNYREWFFYPTATIDHYASHTNFTRDKELIGKNNCRGYEEVDFDVNKFTTGIYILIEGNLSNARIEIPIDTKRKSTGPTTLSIARREDNATEGVEIVAINAPSGGWRLKLTGEGFSKYSFLIETMKTRGNKNGKDRRDDDNFSQDVTTIPQKSFDPTPSEHHKQIWKSLDNVEVFDELAENTSRIFTGDDSAEDPEIRSKRDKAELRIGNLPAPLLMVQSEEREDIRSRLSNEPRNKIVFENANLNVSRMMEKNQELAEEFARIGDDEKEEKKRIVVELNENSNLFVRPGSIHRIIFDVTNNHYQTIGCYFKVRSLPLAVYNVQPVYTWIFAGRTVNVFVDVEVPSRTNQDVINTLTLYVQGSEIIEKSVYLYVEGAIPNVVDDTKPSIEYTFNNNCAGKLNKNRCSKSRWSVDIRVQDSGSGLKNVKASPNELYPRTEFVSGTRSPVTFYYSATCCSIQAKITATDLRNNVNEYTIDVTAWDNLSEAEIAAITVGALLILLLIILIIILIIYCIRRRKSHDLPYTQRYGSRPPAHAERTSF